MPVFAEQIDGLTFWISSRYVMQGLHRYRIRQYEFIFILIVQDDIHQARHPRLRGYLRAVCSRQARRARRARFIIIFFSLFFSSSPSFTRATIVPLVEFHYFSSSSSPSIVLATLNLVANAA